MKKKIKSIIISLVVIVCFLFTFNLVEKKVMLSKLINKLEEINPKTGKGVISTLLSATVVANRCVEADAMATMFMAMGDKAAVALAEELKREGIEVYFILANGEEFEIFSTLENM